jgi:hypothetical protein
LKKKRAASPAQAGYFSNCLAETPSALGQKNPGGTPEEASRQGSQMVYSCTAFY